MSALARILIADDDPDYLHVISDYLSLRGYDCKCVPDGDTATEELLEHDYDLLIADIEMPGNPDLDLIHRATELHPRTPIILVTGYPCIETAATSLGLNVAAYLVKPVEFGELISQVEEALRPYRMTRILQSLDDRVNDWMRCLPPLREKLLLHQGDSHDMDVRNFTVTSLATMVSVMADLKSLLCISVPEERPLPLCETNLRS